MIEIDLITGFLGSGKTTFLKKYAEYLATCNDKVGIIENDFGAVNVDMMMLQDILGDKVDVEQIVGGSVVADWKRRFRTKLISMAMRGFNRILVEPSGIYDVDAFFDVLQDEPVDSWYQIGNIYTILDASLDSNMSPQEEYLLVSQLANTGKLIFSKVQEVDEATLLSTLDYVNRCLEKYKCPRRFHLGNHGDADPQSVSLTKQWNDLTPADFQSLMKSGWMRADHERLWFDQKEAFSSLYYMHPTIAPWKLEETTQALFQNSSCGTIFRIKGYLPDGKGSWLQLNATAGHTSITPVTHGQEIIIVIGQGLSDEIIRPYWY